MASITLKNIPEDLHVLYKRRAKRNSRSLQAEILLTLSERGNNTDDQDFLEVDDVCGMLKSKVKGVTIEDMHKGIGGMFRKSWKR